jgi:hypothetical protein
MKIIFLILLLFSFVAGIYAQVSNDSSDVSRVIIIKKKWHFNVRNPMMNESPYTAMDARLREEEYLRETAGTDNPSGKLIFKPEKRQSESSVEKKRGSASANYIYEVKVKNISEKEIKVLALDYLFFDSDTKRLLGRRRLVNKNNIAAGKTKNLVFSSVIPPTGTIKAKNVEKKTSERYLEQVIIRSVEYVDGTKWQASLKNK